MQILILAVGNKMPEWVSIAFNDYKKRMPPQLRLDLKEIPPVKRYGKDSDAKAKQLEAKAIIAALPKYARIIALDERGKQFSSEELAQKLNSWQELGTDVVLIVGGPDGLTDEIRQLAHELWSLSKLTLPHPLVRVFLAETIYRAYSICAALPYHRA